MKEAHEFLPKGRSCVVGQMIERVSDLPPPEYPFRGIVSPASFGAIFGTAKSGKTIFTESLLFSIAAGMKEFLGEKLNAHNKKVLLISLEEYYRNRTVRNQKQIEFLNQNQECSAGWEQNVFVVDENFPRYIYSEEDWQLLESEIERIKPSVVMIDSLTRLTTDPIEDSTTASKLMRKLREITYKYKVILIVIHHSQKIDNKPLNISTMAGSRVVGQELDFMLGINRANNVRYLKDVAFRYAQETEKVLTFTINEGLFAIPGEYCTEDEILMKTNSSEIKSNEDLIYEFFVSKGAIPVSYPDLQIRFVATGTMTKQTVFNILRKMVTAGAVKKLKHGNYQMIP